MHNSANIPCPDWQPMDRIQPNLTCREPRYAQKETSRLQDRKNIWGNTVRRRGGWITVSETQMLFLAQNTLRPAPHNASDVSNISCPASSARTNPSSSGAGAQPRSATDLVGALALHPYENTLMVYPPPQPPPSLLYSTSSVPANIQLKISPASVAHQPSLADLGGQLTSGAGGEPEIYFFLD